MLAETNALITRNDLCRVQDFNIFPVENFPDPPPPPAIKHDYVLASVPPSQTYIIKKSVPESRTPPKFF